MATCVSEKADLVNAHNQEYPAEYLPRNEHNTPWPQDEAQRRRPFTKRSLLLAYLLWFPFGLLGFHRFYLRYNAMGMIYMFTLGYCGIGWLVDGFFLPSMVKERNEWLDHVASHPQEVRLNYDCWSVGYRFGDLYGPLFHRSLRDAYILTLNPLGIFGIQHHYLGKPWYRLAYPLTGGLIGIGWLTDIFRMPALVRQSNAEIKLIIEGIGPEELRRHQVKDCNKFQAYLFALPGPGILGFHHFYLGRIKIGFVYFFTAGLFGIGWLVDLIRLSWLVSRSNKERKETPMKHVDDAYVFALNPAGILGFHHFYLNRPCWGLIYFFTGGLFVIGWLVDLCRIPSLVKAANLRIKQSMALITTQQQTYVVPADTNVYIFGANNQNGYQSVPVYPNAPDQQHAQHPMPTQYPPVPQPRGYPPGPTPQGYLPGPPPQGYPPGPPPQGYPPGPLPQGYPGLSSHHNIPPPQYTPSQGVGASGADQSQGVGAAGAYQSELPPAYTAEQTTSEQPSVNVQQQDELKRYPPP